FLLPIWIEADALPWPFSSCLASPRPSSLVCETTAVFLLPNWPVNAVFAPLTTGPAAGETLLFVWATAESFFSPACMVAWLFLPPSWPTLTLFFTPNCALNELFVKSAVVKFLFGGELVWLVAAVLPRPTWTLPELFLPFASLLT